MSSERKRSPRLSEQAWPTSLYERSFVQDVEATSTSHAHGANEMILLKPTFLAQHPVLTTCFLTRASPHLSLRGTKDRKGF